MAYTPPKYPSQIPSQTGVDPDLPDKTDDIDWLMAVWFNAIKKELCAIMTELGTLPKGAYADVKTRLDTLETGLVPSGVIVMWSGLLSAIPTGWALCDGNSGRPNLLDKFVRCVPDAVTDPGGTGGAATHVHTQPTHTHTGPSHTHSGPSHTHGVGTFAAASHVLIIAEIPAHTHSYVGIGGGGETVSGDALPTDTLASGSTGGGLGHTHSVSGTSAAGGTGATGANGTGATGAGGNENTASANNAPPYYEVAFIIKT